MGWNICLPTSEPLLNCVSWLTYWEKDPLFALPRSFQQTWGLKSVSPGSSWSRAPQLLQTAHLSSQSASELRLRCSVCSVFSTGIPAQSKLPKAPHPALKFLGNLNICLCLGQKHVLNCLLQLRREGRWLNLPFSTRLNRAYNKTLRKGVTTSQLHVCACAVCGKEFAEEMPIFPQFPAGQEPQPGPGLMQFSSPESCVWENCWILSILFLLGVEMLVTLQFLLQTRQMYRQSQTFCPGVIWSEHQFGSQGGHSVWSLGTQQPFWSGTILHQTSSEGSEEPRMVCPCPDSQANLCQQASAFLRT